MLITMLDLDADVDDQMHETAKRGLGQSVSVMRDLKTLGLYLPSLPAVSCCDLLFYNAGEFRTHLRY